MRIGRPTRQRAQPLPKIADVLLTLNNFAVPADLLLVTGTYAGNVTITLGPAS